MGWYYPSGVNRKELIAQRVEGWERETDEMLVTSSCLKHCYRGNVYSGVLWGVWEQTYTKDGKELQPNQRWIQCDLLRCHQGCWGYKPMDESFGPFYYSCPLSYLELVPLDRYSGDPEWREAVTEHHRRRAEKRAKRTTA